MKTFSSIQAVWTTKSKVAMQQKAESGILPGCPPVGYRNVIWGREHLIEPDLLKSHLVNQLFVLIADGKSIREAGRIVDQLGLTSRNGKRLGPSAIYAIITNPFYMGMLRYNGELIEGKHEAIVSQKLFERVQEQLRL